LFHHAAEFDKQKLVLGPGFLLLTYTFDLEELNRAYWMESSDNNSIVLEVGHLLEISGFISKFLTVVDDAQSEGLDVGEANDGLGCVAF
jgi:hypothetical protein